MAKYRVKRNDWEVSGPSYQFSGIWRGIISVRDPFAVNVKHKIALGEDVFFWLDVWVGDRPHSKEFNSLFICASNKLAKVRDYMEKINDNTVWTLIFRRHLQDDEERELMRLLGDLN